VEEELGRGDETVWLGVSGFKYIQPVIVVAARIINNNLSLTIPILKLNFEDAKTT
jgi:hypothetical protein